MGLVAEGAVWATTNTGARNRPELGSGSVLTFTKPIDLELIIIDLNSLSGLNRRRIAGGHLV